MIIKWSYKSDIISQNVCVKPVLSGDEELIPHLAREPSFAFYKTCANRLSRIWAGSQRAIFSFKENMRKSLILPVEGSQRAKFYFSQNMCDKPVLSGDEVLILSLSKDLKSKDLNY